MQTKKCNKCHTDKSMDQFSPMKGGKYGLSSWCKSCHRDYQRRRRQARDTLMSNATPQATGLLTDELLPNVLVIPIRSDRAVMVGNIPFDLTRGEADRIERILKAFADDDPTCGERS
jgi:hypothetical protein